MKSFSEWKLGTNNPGGQAAPQKPYYRKKGSVRTAQISGFTQSLQFSNSQDTVLIIINS